MRVAARQGLQLLDRIGSGGMGEVYLAKRIGASGFEKVVVVKRLPSHLTGDPKFHEALIREAKLMVRLNHRHIVQVLDLIADEGEHLMVLEFVDGYSLRPLIAYAADQGTPFPLGFVIDVMLQTLDALAYAHEFTDDDGVHSPVIHCDVTPDNLLLSRRGEVKLADFGIAMTFQGTSLTTDGQVRGKLRYVAPEQLSQGKLTPACDVFSVALVLYELLTLDFARRSKETPALINEALSAGPLELPRSLPDATPELRAILRRASAREPGNRYADANAMQAALRNFANRQGLELGPTGPTAELVSSLFSRPDFPPDGKRLPRLSQLPPGDRALATTSLVGDAEKTRVDSPTGRVPRPSVPTVLLVDDSDIVRGLLEDALPNFGLRVIGVESAGDAFKWLADNHCDAVLADLNMPEMGGLELCTFMRSNPSLAHIPILLLTSETDSSRVVTGLGVGADDYIRKGVSEAEIAARVLAVLRRAGGK